MDLTKIDVHNPCGYCGEKISLPLYPTSDIHQNDYQLNHCQKCQAVFLAPRPSDRALIAAYDDSYYGEEEEKFDSFVEKVLDFFRRRRAANLASYLPDGGHILDIGCGNGRFLQFILQQGNFKGYGIELPGKAARRAAKISEIHLKTGQLQADDFADNSLDGATMVHVFEHLTEPKETLEILSQKIRPGGIIAIYLPNIDSFQSQLFKGKWLHADPPRHLFFFKPKDLIHTMQELGFDIVEESYFSPEYNPFGMQQSLLNTICRKRELLYEHLKGNTSYTSDYPSWKLAFQKLFFQLSFPIFILIDLLVSFFKRGATFAFIFKKRLK